MKKIVLFFVFMVLLSCNKNSFIKPKKLIDRATMTDIMYDLSVLQGLRNVKPELLYNENNTFSSYIYTKYGIDSLQFLENSRYYALDIEYYEKMYQELEYRLLKNKQEVDSIIRVDESLETTIQISKDTI